MRAHPTLAPFRALLSAWSAELGFFACVGPLLSCGRRRHSGRIRPPEVSSIGPHPVHDHGEPACESDLRAFHAASLRDPHGPGSERRPSAMMQQNVRCLIQGCADHLVTATTDAAVVVSLPRTVAFRREAEMRSDIARSRKALGRINARPIGERHNHADAGNGLSLRQTGSRRANCWQRRSSRSNSSSRARCRATLAR